MRIQEVVQKITASGAGYADFFLVLCGAFCHPAAVWCAPQLGQTLKSRKSSKIARVPQKRQHPSPSPERGGKTSAGLFLLLLDRFFVGIKPNFGGFQNGSQWPIRGSLNAVIRRALL